MYPPHTHTNTVEIHTYCNPQVFNLIMDNFKKKIKISSDNGMGYVVQSQNVLLHISNGKKKKKNRSDWKLSSNSLLFLPMTQKKNLLMCFVMFC